jgi:hypothetical protein
VHTVQNLIRSDQQQILPPPFQHRQIIALWHDDQLALPPLGSDPFDKLKFAGHRRDLRVTITVKVFGRTECSVILPSPNLIRKTPK